MVLGCYFYWMCLPACMHSAMRVQCIWRPEECVRSLELELQEVPSCLVGAGNQTLVCLQEQQVILVAEPSLQP